MPLGGYRGVPEEIWNTTREIWNMSRVCMEVHSWLFCRLDILLSDRLDSGFVSYWNGSGAGSDLDLSGERSFQSAAASTCNALSVLLHQCYSSKVDSRQNYSRVHTSNLTEFVSASGLNLCIPHLFQCGLPVDARVDGGLHRFVYKRVQGRSVRHHAPRDPQWFGRSMLCLSRKSRIVAHTWKETCCSDTCFMTKKSNYFIVRP